MASGSALDLGRQYGRMCCVCPRKPILGCTAGAGWSSPVAREAHNLEVAGSNPVPATLIIPGSQGCLEELFAAGRQMDVAGVREALRREPFEPFVIRLADGRSVEVKHPESVALTPRRMIVIADDEVGSWSVIEPLLMVSLDYHRAKDKRDDGSSKRRRRGS
jgi:hypothetical protein